MNLHCRIQDKRVAALLLFTLLSPLSWGDSSYDLLKGKPAVTAPSPPPPQDKPRSAPLDCTQPNRDSRCRPLTPDYHPNPYYRRPVIVNQSPATQPIDTGALKDDWEGCRSTKLTAIHSRNNGDMEQANRLDEWLWKNCRSYSEELRDLEQDQM